MESLHYTWLSSQFALSNYEFIKSCSDLYSNHYGLWGANSNNPGKNVELSPKRLESWLENENSCIYYAETDSGEIIGYAIAVLQKVPKYGVISWVTQLVVHENYRQHGVAKNLLYSIWGLSDHFAWGIVSANPYAIRALEKATRRRCDPERIKKNIKKLIMLGAENLTYIQKDTSYNVSNETSQINTEFFVDHSTIPEMIANVNTPNTPWTLGNLEEGWEWIAFTFNDQPQISLTSDEIENMISSSDSVVRTAYSRMQLNTGNQKWTKHTEEEVNLIIEKCNLTAGSTVLDFGCGIGRHTISLGEKGLKAVGIDYLPINIREAQQEKEKKGLINIEFKEGDCRSIELEQADAVICVYDVIGSFADNTENTKILSNIVKSLKPNGVAVISVMNYESTIAKAKHVFDFYKEANKLLTLPPSNTMETTGNVFNPDLILVDKNQHIIYRREQFTLGTSLPMELIVRDRRFTKKEICDMCVEVGLEVLESSYVSASNWRIPLASDESSAKEILLICKKVNF